ncbi:NAD(P)/FAD-dependent oxidoreductase [Lunatibacter salilacus]|uniref:NAD(P)/FAD-dependent oxidoreductase n=1 Tax=Lunatibacter salilacus TaxID=2483804 RepID=UPI00131E5AD0|nr:FAD-dependent oxidoreductase [Lunatibacter salilacus]
MSNSARKIVIIGNGISGVTCARHIRKKDGQAEILIISGETDHFFSRTALMYIYMGHMKYEHTKPYEDWFWDKNRIALKKAWVTQVDFDKKELLLAEGECIPYNTLILATGSKPNTFGWPGQDLEGVQGLYSMQDLEKMEKNTPAVRRAVVVGGGLIGIEMAEMFRSRDIPVTFLVRESNFWDNVLPKEEAQLINRHIRTHHIDLRLETELEEILSDDTGRVRALKTKSGEEIACEFVGLTVGVRPNITFLEKNNKRLTDNDKTGLDLSLGILVDAYFKTNIPDVFAIGDCAEFRERPAADRKTIEQVWYTGRMHGETLAHNLTANSSVPYLPGVWFNSAKFMDIEYQTYGQVPPTLEPGTDTFYWEKDRTAIRFVYNSSNDNLLGVNAFGWRLRHDFFDTAISEGWTMATVLGQLDKANFNPEFFKNHIQEVLAKYRQKTGRSITIKKPSFFHRLIGSRA